MSMSPPPTNKKFISADEAFEALQAHARQSGYALVKTRPSSYENGKPRRYDIACACGSQPYKSKASGLRNSTTRKTGCPFKMKIVQRKDSDNKWVPGMLCSDHNHDSNPLLSYPEHRRAALTADQKTTLTRLLGHSTLSARAINETLKLQYPDVYLTEKDISNLRQQHEQDLLQGRTSTQAVIGALEDEGFAFKIKLDDEDRLEYLLVVLDRDFHLWQHHSHVMMLDVTYNTNRYGLKLLEINGITSLGTVFPLAFVLSPNENAEFFSWSLRQISRFFRNFCEEAELEPRFLDPYVIITDFDAAAKVGMREVFPNSQHQLCVWHISKNITKGVKQRWFLQSRAFSLLNDIEMPDPIQEDQKLFQKCWRDLVFAETEEDFDKMWFKLQQDYHPQEDLLSYIEKTYIPVRHQWANAFTRKYRNFGHTTTSPCEAQHSSSRSFLRNGNSNLYELVRALIRQQETANENYNAQAALESRRNRNSYRYKLFNNVVDKVSYKSLRKVQDQVNFAKAALLQPLEYPLGPCSTLFSAQYGLPCKHIIADYLKLVDEEDQAGQAGRRQVKVIRPLELELWDNQWLLRTDLVETDPIRRIRDPRIKARRQSPQNLPVASPQPPEPVPRAASSQTPSEASFQQSSRRSTPRQRREASQPPRGIEASIYDALTRMMPSILHQALAAMPPGQLATAGIAGSQRTSQTPPMIPQYPVFPRRSTPNHTIQRSQADQLSLKRIPSGFEAYEPPRATSSGPFAGYMDRTRFFEQPGLRSPIINSLNFVEGGHPGPLTSAPEGTNALLFSQLNTAQNAEIAVASGNSGDFQRIQRRRQQQQQGVVESLQPYDHFHYHG